VTGAKPGRAKVSVVPGVVVVVAFNVNVLVVIIVALKVVVQPVGDDDEV